ncbi:MAG: hypothetical protein KDD47_20235 [Acidobacteria bacterium]|nr:hypothetical protein [Acidobacteriota bacterium]
MNGTKTPPIRLIDTPETGGSHAERETPYGVGLLELVTPPLPATEAEIAYGQALYEERKGIDHAEDR